jgi:hypothetical protein
MHIEVSTSSEAITITFPSSAQSALHLTEIVAILMQWIDPILALGSDKHVLSFPKNEKAPLEETAAYLVDVQFSCTPALHQLPQHFAQRLDNRSNALGIVHSRGDESKGDQIPRHRFKVVVDQMRDVLNERIALIYRNLEERS